MTIASSQTRDQFPLSHKKVFKKTLAGALGILILLIIVLIFASFSLTALNISSVLLTLLPLLLILTIGSIILTFLYQEWYFAVYFYDLTPDFIIIRKGPITPREITIPYERIQDVYVDQDILDRLFGLYDVHLSSATISSAMEAHIDGLEKAAAEGVRAALLQTVSQKISKK